MGKVSRVIEGRYYDIVIEKKKKNKINLRFPTGQLMLLFSFRLLLCSIIILVVSARATKSSSQSTTDQSNLYVRAESVNTVNPASRIINNNINSYNDNKRKTKSSSSSQSKTPPYATNSSSSSSSSSSNTKRNNTVNNHLQFQTVKKFSGINPS